MKVRKLAALTALLGSLVIACGGTADSETDMTQQALHRANEFYVTAHMTNSIESVRWAVREGANAVEMDLRFHADGTPDEFRHGGICDCSCNPVNDGTHVCQQLRAGESNACETSTKALDMMAELVKQSDKLALVFIDSKVDGSMPTSQQQASGKRVIDMLDTHLFDRGYRGKVMVSAGKANAYEYLLSAAKRANESPFRSRIYFALDQMGDSGEDAANALSILTQLPTRNRAFGTGITSCFANNFEAAISTGDQNEDNYTSALTYLWTIDSEKSMNQYLSRTRPRAILTNKPALLRRVALSRGLKLAEPETPFTDVISDSIVGPTNRSCRCDYHKGGCTIAEPAPPGTACSCSYVFLWTCRGDLTTCTSANDEKCKRPDATKESCLQGRGDCGGYR
ncbi:MAG: hypothetical protein U0174_08100 [Polyangiaceae bacterium]